ncbi:response regulator [Candidatus Omnitrophota bacterium]
MKQNEEKYKILTKIIPDIIYEFDPNGRFTFVSDAIRELGYNPQELIGKHFGEIVHPDDRESIGYYGLLKDKKEKSVFEGAPKCLEMKLVINNQGSVSAAYHYTELHFSAKWEKSTGEEKRFLGTIGVIKDINRRRIAEEKLEKAQTTLLETYEQLVQAEKLSVVGQLASDVAHEVKNLLGILIQDVNYLESKLSSKKDIREVFNMMKSNVHRADKITRSLVDFSRETKLEIRKQDINSIIEASSALICHRPHKGKIEIITDLQKNLPEVLVDKGKMEQVFVNIFLNAIHAMPGQGTLSIRSYVKQLDSLEDEAYERTRDYFGARGKVVVVEIEDTGSGITAENLKKIFDPFFSTKGPGKQSGLGLSVTKKIIAMHKGFIDVESEVGKGTRFIIALRIPQAAGDIKTKVMIVDDEVDFLKIAKLNLETIHDYQVLILPSAKDIISEVNRFKPDVILLDILMPIVGGHDCCEKLSNDPLGKSIPIIILSAVDNDIDKDRAYRAGVKDYLIKPIEINALVAKLEKVLSPKR